MSVTPGDQLTLSLIHICTNGIYSMGRHKETANTTPESYELQKTFREFLDAGCDTCLLYTSRCV